MTAHHFFVDPADITETSVVLRGDEAYHAARVLRVRIGEAITAADGTGRIVDAIVSTIDDTVECETRGSTDVAMPVPRVTLFQAVTKGDKLELVVEKATEVGVGRIVPFVAERTISRWDDRKLLRVQERLSAIARSAAKQSRAAFVPTVDAITTGVRPDGVTLLLHEEAVVRLREALPSQAPEELSLVVGPEGGLTPAEVDRLTAAGARAVSLGPRVLRTETAGPVATAVVGYAYGWFG